MQESKMSSVTVFLFRILLVIGGFILMYIIGKPVVETLQYQLSGNSVKGVVIGFRGSKSSKTVFDDNTANGYAKSTIIIPWLNFEMYEEVKVVMDKNDPTRSHIFSKGILMTDVILILLCLYMVKLGITRSDS